VFFFKKRFEEQILFKKIRRWKMW